MLTACLQNINLDAPMNETCLTDELQDYSGYRTYEYWIHWHSLKVSGEYERVFRTVTDIGERLQTSLRGSMGQPERLTVRSYAGSVPDHEKAEQEVVLKFPGIGTEVLVSYDAVMSGHEETILASRTRYVFDQINDLVRLSMKDYYSIAQEANNA